MQGMTHFAVGILGYSLYRCASAYIDVPSSRASTTKADNSRALQPKLLKLAIGFVLVVLVVLSHTVLDALAVATYHPPEALTNSYFWLAFHAVVVLGAVFLVWRYRRAWLFLLASIVPDSDWIARPFGWWGEGAVHEWFRQLPVLSTINNFLSAHLPDWRMEPLASTNELLLFVLLMLFSLLSVRIYANQTVNKGG